MLCILCVPGGLKKAPLLPSFTTCTYANDIWSHPQNLDLIQKSWRWIGTTSLRVPDAWKIPISSSLHFPLFIYSSIHPFCCLLPGLIKQWYPHLQLPYHLLQMLKWKANWYIIFPECPGFTLGPPLIWTCLKTPPQGGLQRTISTGYFRCGAVAALLLAPLELLSSSIFL